MTLVEHARRELELIGEDPMMIDWYVKVIKAFASYGHSGGSASVTVPILHELLQFHNLAPLTDNPTEWMTVSEQSGKTLWQSRRRANAFSHDGGKTYYLLSEGASADNPTPLHTSHPYQLPFEETSDQQEDADPADVIAPTVGDTIDEIDRNARAYGWEVGHGHPLARRIEETHPDNPFIDKNWRDNVKE